MMRLALLITGLLGAILLRAQNVGISATGSQPNASALLDVASSTSGLLVPRLTTAQRNAITSPATGLLIFHTPLQRYEYFDGTLWRPLLQEGRAWGLAGNAGTSPTMDFLGTTDAQDLVLRTNGTERTRLTAANGRLGLGTGAPSEVLDVQGRIRMEDGAQGPGKVLTSDTDGTGHWNGPPRPIYYHAFGQSGVIDMEYNGFVPMPDMEVDLVPRDSILIIHFSSSGIFWGNLPFLCTEYAISFQLIVNGKLIRIFHASNETFNNLSIANRRGYNIEVTYPIEVTPGNNTRISMNWGIIGCSDATLWNGTIIDATSHRSLIVIDPNGIGQSSYIGPPSQPQGWNISGNSATNQLFDFIGTTDNQGITLITNSLYRLRLANNGNLGLGTLLPTATLHVVGGFRLLNGSQGTGLLLTSDAQGNATWSPMGQIAWGLTGNTGTNAATHYAGTGDLQPFVLRTDAQERLRVTATGNVGIGTDVPGGRLTLSRPVEAATEQLEVRNAGGITDGNYDGLRWTQGATGGTTLGNVRVHYHSNGTTDLSLGTRFDPQALFIEHGGQLGIGTTTPDRHLEVSGAGTQYARVTSNNGGIVGLEFLRTGGGSDWRIRNDAGLLFFGQSNDDLTTVTDVLRLGGGSVTPAADNAFPLGTAALRWTQVFAVNGAIQTSDRRLKTDIRPMEDGLAAILRLRPVTYRWKHAVDDTRRPGLLAQEVRRVVPEVVVGKGRLGPLGMNYAELVPVLIDALQQLEGRLQDLEAERERLLLELDGARAGSP